MTEEAILAGIDAALCEAIASVLHDEEGAAQRLQALRIMQGEIEWALLTAHVRGLSLGAHLDEERFN